MGRKSQKTSKNVKKRRFIARVRFSTQVRTRYYFLLRLLLDATTSIEMSQGKRKRANEPRSALIVTSSRRCRSTSVARSPRVSMRRKLPRRPQRPRAPTSSKGLFFRALPSLFFFLLLFSFEHSLSWFIGRRTNDGFTTKTNVISHRWIPLPLFYRVYHRRAISPREQLLVRRKIVDKNQI